MVRRPRVRTGVRRRAAVTERSGSWKQSVRRVFPSHDRGHRAPFQGDSVYGSGEDGWTVRRGGTLMY